MLAGGSGDSPGSLVGTWCSKSGLALGSLGFAAGTKGRAGALRDWGWGKEMPE